MSTFAILRPKWDINVAYTAFPRAYDHIIKFGKEGNRVAITDYKGLTIGHELYTAGVFQRHILCIRHYDPPIDEKSQQVWREDDLFVFDLVFNDLIKSLYLYDFSMKFIRK